MWIKLTKNVIATFGGTYLDRKMLSDFIKRNNFIDYCFPYQQNFRKLFITGRNHEDFNYSTPPYVDHPRAFRKANKIACLVFNTYAQPNQIGNSVQDWANQYDLQADVYNPEKSWYWPGKTTMVVIHLPEDKVIV